MTSTEQPTIPRESLEEARFDRLVRQLTSDGVMLDRDVPPERLKGGLANLNYRISIEGKPFVLRVAPGGDIPAGAHDMAREHRVLSRLSTVFPLAPNSIYLCEDRDVLGAPFQLIEYRQGRTIRGEDLSALKDGEDLGASLHEILADVMARLHAVDPATCDLDGLGKPENFLQRAASGWTRRGQAATKDLPVATAVREISDWISAALDRIPGLPPALLHCDIKLDNLILAEDSLTPCALVDWDMSTRGDPRFDLATLLSYWSEPGDPSCFTLLHQMPTALPGFESRDVMAEAYRRRTGRELAGLDAVFLLCLFKLGVVFLQLHDRWKSGAIGDERYARFETMGTEILEHTLSLAREANRKGR